MTVMPLTYVDAPASTPPRFGILSAAVVVEDNDPHSPGFGFEYEPDFCGPARMTPALCMASQPKTADEGRDVVEGQPFVVYAMNNCKSIGLRDARERAQRSLTLGEGRAVEEWLGARLAAEADDNNGTWTAADAVEALAAMEHYIHCNYGGVGTIHMGRGTASGLLTADALVTNGDRLLTKLGNRVSAGCYDVDDAPQRIYATGTVSLRRGPVWSPPDAIIDTETNDTYGLAERPYAGAWECFAVGVTVTAGP